MKYKFICPIFRDEVFLFIGDIDKAKKFCKGLEISPNHTGKCSEIQDKETKVEGFLVWIDEPKNYNTMVHECLHLVSYIFKMHNIPFNETNDEIIAYYQNYWVRKFWNKMSKSVN